MSRECSEDEKKLWRKKNTGIERVLIFANCFRFLETHRELIPLLKLSLERRMKKAGSKYI